MVSTKKVCLLVCCVVIMLGTLYSCAHKKSYAKKSYSEEELGLRKETLYDETAAMPVTGELPHKSPGESTKIERAFENSPPLIPHDITSMLPIERHDTGNICMGCHMPEEASGSGATAIPKSHLIDHETGKDLDGHLEGSRYNCMQCHVIQTTVTPAVENLFKGEFRDEKGRYRSNLMETLNEGVEAE